MLKRIVMLFFRDALPRIPSFSSMANASAASMLLLTSVPGEAVEPGLMASMETCLEGLASPSNGAEATCCGRNAGFAGSGGRSRSRSAPWVGGWMAGFARKSLSGPEKAPMP